MAKDKKPDTGADEPTKTPEETTQAEEKSTEHEHHDLMVAKGRERPDRSFGDKLKGLLRNKKVMLPLAGVLVLLAVLLIVPTTRAAILGLFAKRSFSVTVVDVESNKAISGAEVSLAGKTAQTDAEGKATFSELKTGKSTVKVTKKYYQDASEQVEISLSKEKNHKDVKMQATGRQVPVSVTNKLTGKVLSGAVIQALDTEAPTDEKGEAIIVLPADQKTLDVKIKKDGFNDLTAKIEVIEQVSDKNKYALTPTGRVYFLSKQSGKIDVVKTNMDGTDRKVVLAGTGKERAYTEMLASRDWKYLALKARREGEKDKLYLIDTSNDKMSVIDEGNVDFRFVGWSGHDLVYAVERGLRTYHPKRQALKSFSADNKQIKILEESNAYGNAANHGYTSIESPTLLGDTVIFLRPFSCYSQQFTFETCFGKESRIVSVKANGNDRKNLKGFLHTQATPPTSFYYVAPQLIQYSMGITVYRPNEVYFTVYVENGSKSTVQYFELKDGVFAQLSKEKKFEDYNTYKVSPSGKETVWAEGRDGKTAILIGDQNGVGGKQVGDLLADKTSYGWLTDDYLLLASSGRNTGSELFVLSREPGAKPVKVADYHGSRAYISSFSGGY